ncbi:hypothetical protein ABT369_28835 [Dactylosporangium sp. NPDC000244]|uniref:hypothetical protein n=1 Tax=Dactylosporangium sp. NPDC000244 TaxID=3154365 RepID=UPI00331F69A4
MQQPTPDCLTVDVGPLVEIVRAHLRLTEALLGCAVQCGWSPLEAAGVRAGLDQCGAELNTIRRNLTTATATDAQT